MPRAGRAPGYDADCARILAAGLGYAPGAHRRAARPAPQARCWPRSIPGTVVTRRRRALAERGVWIGHRGDGTADLTARLDSTDAEQVYAAIRALALAAHRADTAAEGERGAAGGHGARPVALGTAGAAASAGCRAEAARRPFDLRMADALVDLILSPGSESPRGTAAQTTSE